MVGHLIFRHARITLKQLANRWHRKARVMPLSKTLVGVLRASARAVIYPVGWLVLRSFIRLEIIGKSNIPLKDGGVVIYSHPSPIDAVFVRAATWPRFVRFLVGVGAGRSWLFRPIAWLEEVVFIGRRFSVGRLRGSFDSLRKTVEAGGLVATAPEGLFRKTGLMLPMRRGFDLLRRHLPNIPLIPVAIDGAWHGVPVLLGKYARYRCEDGQRTSIRVVIGPPLYGEVTQQHIRRLFQELDMVAIAHRRIDIDRWDRRTRRQEQRNRTWMSLICKTSSRRYGNRRVEYSTCPSAEIIDTPVQAWNHGDLQVGKPKYSDMRFLCSHPSKSIYIDTRALQCDTANEGQLFEARLEKSSGTFVAMKIEDIAKNSLVFAEIIRCNRADRVLVNFPRTSIEGEILGHWLPVLTGARTEWVQDDGAFAESAKEGGFAFLFSQLSGFRKLAESVTSQVRRSLKYAAVVGFRTNLAELNSVARQIGFTVHAVTCAPELGGIAFVNLPDFGPHRGSYPGSIGHPLPGVAVRVVHPASCQDMEDGKIGVVLFRSATRPKDIAHYLDPLGRDVFQGWTPLSRMGWMNETGFVYLGKASVHGGRKL